MANETKEVPVIINGRVFWRIGEQLLPAIAGAASDPPAPGSASPPASDQTPTDAPAPKYMTAEDFNGAVTARERRLEQRIAKMLDERFSQFAAPKPAAANADDEVEHEPAKPAAAGDPRPDDKEVRKLKDEMARMKKERQREREETERKEQVRLVADAKSQVQAALVEAGSSGPHSKAALALLSEEGRIKRNEAGEVCVELPRTYLGKTDLELVPLKEGIPEWLNSDAGKLFLPPRGGGEGSGTTIRGGANRAGGPLSKEEAKKEAQRAIAAWAFGSR